MGCRCGKNRNTLPAGSNPRPSGKSAVRQAPAPNEKLTKAAQSFELKTPSGKVQSFGSRLEMLAAQRRFGGTISSR